MERFVKNYISLIKIRPDEWFRYCQQAFSWQNYRKSFHYTYNFVVFVNFVVYMFIKIKFGIQELGRMMTHYELPPVNSRDLSVSWSYEVTGQIKYAISPRPETCGHQTGRVLTNRERLLFLKFHPKRLLTSVWPRDKLRKFVTTNLGRVLTSGRRFKTLTPKSTFSYSWKKYDQNYKNREFNSVRFNPNASEIMIGATIAFQKFNFFFALDLARAFRRV